VKLIFRVAVLARLEALVPPRPLRNPQNQLQGTAGRASPLGASWAAKLYVGARWLYRPTMMHPDLQKWGLYVQTLAGLIIQAAHPRIRERPAGAVIARPGPLCL